MKDKISDYVNRSLDGDTEAFSVLYRMTVRRIYYICMNLLKNSYDADDVVQETYLSAYRNLARLDDVSKFSAWIERTAVNKCMDFLRRKKPVPFDEPETGENIPDKDCDVLPEQYVINSEKRRIFMKIMRNSLSDLQYRTVFLYYFNDLTVREISVLMDCTEGAVKNRLSTARSKIKSGVEKYQRDSGDKLYAVPVLTALFEEESGNVHIPDIKSFAVKSVPEKLGKAGTNMIKLKLIAGTAAVITAAGGTAVYFNDGSRSVSTLPVSSYTEEKEEQTLPENVGVNMVVPETEPSAAFSVMTAGTTTTTETTSATITTSSATETTTTTVTEVQTQPETVPEIISEIPETSEPVTEIYEEPSQTVTDSPADYQEILDEINTYQDRFFEYVKITNDSTNGMIEMCKGKPINEDFEGEERERFLEFSALADEYEQKIYDLFDETEEVVKSLENNPYYDYYVRSESDLLEDNFGAPQGAYVGSVQQWYAINSNYEKLLEYLMSELETRLPEETYNLIQQSETEWAEKHEYFLNNVIIYDGNWSHPSTGQFEARSRKYRCLMLMFYYCRTL